MWATCNNFGNIVGIQLAAGLIDTFNGEWQWLMVVASVFAAIMALVTYFFLNTNPEELGIFVEDMTEKEALIAVAT